MGRVKAASMDFIDLIVSLEEIQLAANTTLTLNHLISLLSETLQIINAPPCSPS